MQSRKWSFRFGNCSIWFRSCSICSAKRPIGCENRISRSEGIKNILYILTDFLLRRISAVLSFPSIFSLLAGELWWTSVAWGRTAPERWKCIPSALSGLAPTLVILLWQFDSWSIGKCHHSNGDGDYGTVSPAIGNRFPQSDPSLGLDYIPRSFLCDVSTSPIKQKIK